MKQFCKAAACMLTVLLCAALTSCGKSIRGTWVATESVTGIQYLTYEFGAKDYTQTVNIVLGKVQYRGTYRVENGHLYTTATEVSTDNGETWAENSGLLVSNREQSQVLSFESDGSIKIDDTTLVKVVKK